MGVSRGVVRARWVQVIMVCVIAAGMLGASDPEGRFDRVGHQMVCPCSCGQVLVECNHVGCPDSARMIGELRAQIAADQTDTMILNWFAAKYGAMVLGAPIRGGFDRVAWIAPFTVFLFATVGMAFLIKVWRQRSVVGGAGMAGVGAEMPGTRGSRAEADSMRERIRRETEY